MNTIYLKYLIEKDWSNKVVLKWHAPNGLFKNGSSKEIAKTVSKNVDYKTAMSRLNFFINRAGSKLSPNIKTKVLQAKKLLKNENS
jgi:hypothetical protein